MHNFSWPWAQHREGPALGVDEGSYVGGGSHRQAAPPPLPDPRGPDPPPVGWRSRLSITQTVIECDIENVLDYQLQ